MKRLTSPLVAILLATLTAQSALATENLIWQRLQGTSPKGYVLLLRHALAPGVGDPEGFRVDDCSTQRNLSAAGRAQAQELGKWIRDRQVTIYRIESSRWCRAKETARLLGLGKVRLNKNLDSLFEESDIANHPQTLKARKQIVGHRDKRGLLILVGHYVNIAALAGVGVDSGKGVLVRADRSGQIKVFGEVPGTLAE